VIPRACHRMVRAHRHRHLGLVLACRFVASYLCDRAFFDIPLRRSPLATSAALPARPGGAQLNGVLRPLGGQAAQHLCFEQIASTFPRLRDSIRAMGQGQKKKKISRAQQKHLPAG